MAVGWELCCMHGMPLPPVLRVVCPELPTMVVFDFSSSVVSATAGTYGDVLWAGTADDIAFVVGVFQR